MNKHSVPSNERIEKAIQKAQSLERATVQEDVDQFGNNFFFLFAELKYSKEFNTETEKDGYLADAEAYTDKWSRFLSENTNLLEEIYEALDDQLKYDELLQIYINFLNMKDFEGADAFNKKIDPKLGIEAYRIPIWKRLNSLLKQAADQMRKVGIEPEEFYS